MDYTKIFTILYITLHKMSSEIKMVSLYMVKKGKALQNL